ncbi:MAG: hypothetical protein QM706_12050 [Nitrospira sp.]
MRHIIFVDNINVSLVENFECRTLRNDDGIVLHAADQHCAGLTVTQQTLRIRKIGAKGMFPVSLLKSASIAPILPFCVELAAIRQDEFNFQFILVLLKSAMYSR